MLERLLEQQVGTMIVRGISSIWGPFEIPVKLSTRAGGWTGGKSLQFKNEA
jgi:hypothetical protein